MPTINMTAPEQLAALMVLAAYASPEAVAETVRAPEDIIAEAMSHRPVAIYAAMSGGDTSHIREWEPPFLRELFADGRLTL